MVHVQGDSCNRTIAMHNQYSLLVNMEQNNVFTCMSSLRGLVKVYEVLLAIKRNIKNDPCIKNLPHSQLCMTIGKNLTVINDYSLQVSSDLITECNVTNVNTCWLQGSVLASVCDIWQRNFAPSRAL